MSPKLVVFLAVLVMILLSLRPLMFGIFYLMSRPLFQPYATRHYTLFAGVPLTSVFPLFLISYSTITCIVRKHYTISAPNTIPIYLLILVSSLSFLHSFDYGASVGQILKVLTGVSLYNLMYSGIKNTDDANKVIISIVLASIIPMLIGYYQFFIGTGGKGLMEATNRATGGLGWANMYGIFLAICFCACLMVLLQEKRRRVKIVMVCVLTSIVMSSLIALNRGTWIALSASLVFSYFFYRDNIKSRWLVIAGVLVGIFFSEMIVDRFMQLKETTVWGMSRDTFAGRVAMWKAILSIAHIHPLTGFGIGTANLVLDKFFGISNVPHNDYLRLLLEVGFLGPILYIIFLSRELYRNLRLSFKSPNWPVNFPMLVAITYWVIISCTQNIIHSVTTFPMFLTLVAVSRRWNELRPEGEDLT